MHALIDAASRMVAGLAVAIILMQWARRRRRPDGPRTGMDGALILAAAAAFVLAPGLRVWVAMVAMVGLEEAARAIREASRGEASTAERVSLRSFARRRVVGVAVLAVAALTPVAGEAADLLALPSRRPILAGFLLLQGFGRCCDKGARSDFVVRGQPPGSPPSVS